MTIKQGFLFIFLCTISTKQFAQFSWGTKGRLISADQFTEVYASTSVVGNNVPIFNDGGAVQPASCNDWMCMIGVRNLTDSVYEFEFMLTWGSFNGDPCGNPKNVLLKGTVQPHTDMEYRTSEDFWMGVKVTPGDPALTRIIIDRRHKP